MTRTREKKPDHSAPPLAALGIFLVAAAVGGIGLGAIGLVEPDEARYAAVGQAMWASGDFVTPRLNGFAYLDKPPLLHWLTAVSIGLLGPNEFAVRLSSVLAAAAGIALTYAFGCHVLGHRAGLVSALVLGASLMWFAVARVIRYDMLLALSVTATLWWSFLGSEAGDKGRRYWCLAAISTALGILAKGPIALALPGLVIVAYLGLTRQLRALLQVPWLLCVPILLLIAGPWFALVERANPGAVRFFLLHENVQRLAGEIDPTHHQPWWYLIPVFLGGCLPWTLMLPGAAIDAAGGAKHEALVSRRACALWLLWAGVTVVVFSLSRVKLITYVLPALPAGALLIGRYLSPVRRRGGWECAVTGGLLGAAGIAVWVLGPAAAAKEGLSPQPFVGALGAAMLLGGLACLVLALLGLRKYAVAALAAGALATYAVALWTAGHLPRSPSDRGVARLVAKLQRPGERLVCVRKLSRGAVFYLNERAAVIGAAPAEYEFPGNADRLQGWVVPPDEAADFLARGPAIVICRERFVPELAALAGETATEVGRVPGYVLYRAGPRAARGGRTRP